MAWLFTCSRRRSRDDETKVLDKLEQLSDQLTAVRAKLEDKVSAVEAKVSDVEAKVSDVEAKVSDVEARLTDVQKFQRSQSETQKLLMEVALDRYNLTPQSDYSWAKSRGEWFDKSAEYYQTSSCIILHSLFPSTYSQGLPTWATERGWQSVFPAVAEHIIPAKGYTFTENELQIPVHAVRNSLPLFRHLEKTFQNGDWSLVPTGTRIDRMWFKVYVSKPLWKTHVSYMTACGQWEAFVDVQLESTGQWQQLTFGMLHEKEIAMSTSTLPYMRALFLKARMAWQKHPNDLPNPEDFLEAFQEPCNAWRDFKVAKLLESLAVP